VEEKELVDLVRGDRTVVPFLGAGMALRAGAPSVCALAEALSGAAGLPDGDLETVVEAAEARIGLEDTRIAVAEIIGGIELVPDSRLMKLAQWPAQRILTTNYDDAVEIAAEAAGLKVKTVAVKDTGAISLEPGVVKVIHLHGHNSDPPSIVLPGATTEELVRDEVFLNQVRAMMEQGTMLYLGFSFGPSEAHLRGILPWLQQIENARRHLLVLPADSLTGRGSDLDELQEVPQVTVATYGADPGHTFVEALTSVHARRSYATGTDADLIDSRPPPAYVEPALVREDKGEDLEDLQGKVWGAEGGWGEPFVAPGDLIADGRALLSGQPGMGKTEALRQLARTYEDGESLVVSATVLASTLSDDEPDERGLNALSQAISQGRAGRAATLAPDLDGLARNSYLLLLDDFDLVAVDRRGAVAAAVLLACERWPQHRWVIAGRPSLEFALFSDAGFHGYRILPSESWGREYLVKRGVSDPDIGWLTDQQAGFGAVMGIPLFAAAAVDRLLGAGEAPGTPLDLLVDTQREAAGKEARRLGHSAADWWIWLRRLAVGLELRSRTEASSAELAAVPGRGGLEVEEIREPLVRASLLIELPDHAAFPRRTLQEALCASAILAGKDPVASIEEVALAEVGGVPYLRSDIEFTLDLVFESASLEERRRLREIDEQRWALTVLARGSIQDAGEALDILVGEAGHRGHSLSMFATGLRSPLQAARSIVRAWPSLIAERRERLLGEVGSAAAHRRFNALWLLSSQYQEEDPTWLPALVDDEESRVGLLAAETAAAWRVRDALSQLEAVVSRPGPVHVRRRFLRVALELAEGREETMRIVAALLDDGPLFGESVGDFDALVDLDGYLELLGRRTHDSRIWEWLLDRVLEIATPADWTDERIESLVEAVIAHDGDPQIAADERLVGLVEAHLEIALATARRALYRRPPAFRGLAMFASIPPRELEGEGNAVIVEGAKRALAPAEVERWTRAPRRDLQTIALESLADPEADPASVLEPETHWRVDQMDAVQRRTLAELAASNLPPVGADLGVARYEPSRLKRLQLGALNAAARLEFPMEPGRWMQILRSPDALETSQALFEWLRANYDPSLDPAICAYVAEAEDGLALSTVMAAVPRDARGPREAVARRLDELVIDDGWWANAVGLLAEDYGPGLLRRLQSGSRTESQQENLRERLAALGDVRSQLEILGGLVGRARDGELVGEAPRWPERIDDRSVLEALGELLEALGSERKGSGWWDFALGKLAGSGSEGALSVIDRVIGATGVPLDFARQGLARSLAADLVLARLPQDIAGAAMLLEVDAEGECELFGYSS
jgi:hypothetical protein